MGLSIQSEGIKTSHAKLTVRFYETDLMGIVHHSNYVNYFEIARVDWLKRRGIAYDQCIQQGIHMAVVEVTLRYRKPARFDDTLLMETTVGAVTRVSARFGYRIFRVSFGEQAPTELLCEGNTLVACVAGIDGNHLSPCRIPEEIASILRHGAEPSAIR